METAPSVRYESASVLTQPYRPPNRDADWASASERGSPLGLRFLVWCLRRIGDAPVRLLLVPIASYYCLFGGSARRASGIYLSRVDRVRGGSGGPPRFRDSYRHFLTFAELIVDRVFFWMGAHENFEIVIRGREQMERHLENGRGAFLVGAHLGSFDVLRVVARDAGIPVNVLMFTANAERINETLQALDPSANVRVIDANSTSVHVAFEIRRCVERGEFVAVLADRLQPGRRNRMTYVNFLGEPAAFPESPFLLSIVMGLPVVLTLALKTGPRTYEAIFETLAEGEVVSAQDRRKVLRERIETFAARLEHYCKEAHFQWFNFYDFWAKAEDERR